MKKCSSVYRYICENLDADLSSPECQEVRRHIEECSDCRAYLASVKTTVSLFARAPLPSVPPSVHRQLFDSLSVAWKRDQEARRVRTRKR